MRLAVVSMPNAIEFMPPVDAPEPMATEPVPSAVVVPVVPPKPAREFELFATEPLPKAVELIPIAWD